MKTTKKSIQEMAQKFYDPMVYFAQKLVQTRSDTGQEKEVSEVIYNELKKLGYDEVLRDNTGNIIGIIKGSGTGNSILFNCHMDQVDPGDLEAWEYPPFEGVIEEGYIHGRGASDTKGAIATQIYAGALVKAMNISLDGDLIFTFVVEEEPGDMWGAIRLCEDVLKDKKIAFCISGESTSMDIALGHRGRLEVQVISKGKNSHSSAPWLGVNAVSKMAPMIMAIDEMGKEMPYDGTFRSSLSIINIECHPGFNCVVPDTCTINIDYRFNTEETKDTVLEKFRNLASKLEQEDQDAQYEIRVRRLDHTSYTGVKETAELNKPSFITDINNVYVQKMLHALNEVDQYPKTYFWDFGTDAAYIATVCGIPTVGYSPAEEKYCHSPKDRISISLMQKALEGYVAICAEIAGK